MPWGTNPYTAADHLMLSFIGGFVETHGYSPTQADIQDHVRVCSSMARRRLARLRKGRLVTWEPHASRTLAVTRLGWQRLGRRPRYPAIPPHNPDPGHVPTWDTYRPGCATLPGEILAFMCDHIVKWGFPASSADAIDEFGINLCWFNGPLRILRDARLVVWNPPLARAAQVTEAGWRAAGWDGPPLLAAPDI